MDRAAGKVVTSKPCVERAWSGRGVGAAFDEPRGQGLRDGGREHEAQEKNDYSDSRPLHGDVGRWRRVPSISRVDVGGRIAALSLFLGDAASV